jgi:fructokinase
MTLTSLRWARLASAPAGAGSPSSTWWWSTVSEPASSSVRANTEDVAWLYPGRAPQAVAESWLRLGPGLAVITSGASGVMAIRGSGSALHRRASVHCAADAGLPHGDAAVDTFRAADAFTAGLLGGLDRLRRNAMPIRQLSADDLSEMLDAALQAAGSASGLALIER